MLVLGQSWGPLEQVDQPHLQDNDLSEGQTLFETVTCSEGPGCPWGLGIPWGQRKATVGAERGLCASTKGGLDPKSPECASPNLGRKRLTLQE